jgi:hypothetical protein
MKCWAKCVASLLGSRAPRSRALSHSPFSPLRRCSAPGQQELSPNLGDGLRDQAAAVWDCEDAGLAATSIPSVNLTP